MLKILIVILIALTRVVPHPFNFTPIAAIGMFSGAKFNNKWVWLLPIVLMLIGDFFLGFYNPLIMLVVYFGMAMSVFVGKYLLSKKQSLNRYAGAIGINAIIFYLISNFPIWLAYYPRSFAGLIECYTLAIPFLGYSLLGDTFYTVLIFGLYSLAQKHKNISWNLSPS
jgi:hypothetical protein